MAFGYRIKEQYPQLPENTIKIPFPFPTTYLCEATFCAYTSTKITHHNRLSEGSIRIQLSSIILDIKQIDLQNYKITPLFPVSLKNRYFSQINKYFCIFLF